MVFVVGSFTKSKESIISGGDLLGYKAVEPWALDSVCFSVGPGQKQLFHLRLKVGPQRDLNGHSAVAASLGRNRWFVQGSNVAMKDSKAVKVSCSRVFQVYDFLWAVTVRGSIQKPCP